MYRGICEKAAENGVLSTAPQRPPYRWLQRLRLRAALRRLVRRRPLRAHVSPHQYHLARNLGSLTVATIRHGRSEDYQTASVWPCRCL
jgi:hypothetical protein